MRSRVRRAIASVAVLALLLFGVPLAVVLDRLIASQTLAGLQRDATRGVAAVPDNTLEAGTAVRVPAGAQGVLIGVYDAQGTRVAGAGPARSTLAGLVTDGREHDGHDNGQLAVVMPVLSDTTVAGSVRAAVPLSGLRAASLRAWGLIALLALAVLAVALLLAQRAAARISRPFEALTVAARRLGEGRYDVDVPHWGIAEADAAGGALRDSAAEIDALIRHEREFVRDASHQLRTPLAAVELALARTPPDVTAALARTRDLETTIADLIALRVHSGTGVCDPTRIAAEAVRRRTTPQRPITLRSGTDDLVGLGGPALRQSLDVLLDNAIRHGSGPVTVTIEPYGDAVLIEVEDQGDGFGPRSQPGTGLTLAAGILERAGGSLLIRRRSPRPRIALLVPAAPDQSISKR